MDEAAAVLKASDDEARRICQEIRRIGGSDRPSLWQTVVERGSSCAVGVLRGALLSFILVEAILNNATVIYCIWFKH